MSTFHQQLGTIGTGMISTTPDSIWQKLNGSAIKSPSIASQEKDNSISPNKVDSHNAMKPKSRLVNRLLKTLNSPDTLETALAFSSG